MMNATLDINGATTCILCRICLVACIYICLQNFSKKNGSRPKFRPCLNDALSQRHALFRLQLNPNFMQTSYNFSTFNWLIHNFLFTVIFGPTVNFL